MKSKIFLLSSFLISNISLSQTNTFLKLNQAPNLPHSISTGGGFQNDSNQFICVYDLYFGASSHQGLLLTYNENGERIASKDKSTASLGRYSKINDNLFSISNETNYSVNLIYNQYGNLLWEKNDSPNFQKISAINDSIGFCYADYFKTISGNIIRDERLAKINLNTGDTIFTKSYSNLLNLPDSVSSLYSLIDIATNNGKGFLLFQDNGNNKLSILTLDSLGNSISTLPINVELYDQNLYSANKGVLLLSFHNNSQNFWLKQMENNIVITIDSQIYNYQIVRNKVIVDNQHNIHFCLKHFPGNGKDNYVEVKVYNKKYKLKKSIKYSVPNEDITLNMSIANDNGYFFTGKSTALYPENNAFIMKTDSNGLVENPTLFPLQIDTSLSDSNTSVNLINPTYHFAIYPNPLSFNLQIQGNLQDLKAMKLLDLNGAVLQVFKPSQSLALASLRQGIYILEIESLSGKVERHKVIKQE